MTENPTPTSGIYAGPEATVRWYVDELHRERELRRKADAEATELRVQLMQAQIELERLRQDKSDG